MKTKFKSFNKNTFGSLVSLNKNLFLKSPTLLGVTIVLVLYLLLFEILMVGFDISDYSKKDAFQSIFSINFGFIMMTILLISFVIAPGILISIRNNDLLKRIGNMNMGIGTYIVFTFTFFIIAWAIIISSMVLILGISLFIISGHFYCVFASTRALAIMMIPSLLILMTTLSITMFISIVIRKKLFSIILLVALIFIIFRVSVFADYQFRFDEDKKVLAAVLNIIFVPAYLYNSISIPMVLHYFDGVVLSKRWYINIFVSFGLQLILIPSILISTIALAKDY